MAAQGLRAPGLANVAGTSRAPFVDDSIEFFTNIAHSRISEVLDTSTVGMEASRGAILKKFHARLLPHSKTKISAHLSSLTASQQGAMVRSVRPFHWLNEERKKECFKFHVGKEIILEKSETTKFTEQSPEMIGAIEGSPETTGPTDGSHEIVEITDETKTLEYHLAVVARDNYDFLKMGDAAIGSLTIRSCEIVTEDSTATFSQVTDASIF